MKGLMTVITSFAAKLNIALFQFRRINGGNFIVMTCCRKHFPVLFLSAGPADINRVTVFCTGWILLFVFEIVLMLLYQGVCRFCVLQLITADGAVMACISSGFLRGRNHFINYRMFQHREFLCARLSGGPAGKGFNSGRGTGRLRGNYAIIPVMLQSGNIL